MKCLKWLWLGLPAAFAASWLAFVAYPLVQFGGMQPLPNEATGGFFPAPLPSLAIAGQRVYAANGCVYCHSQQVRISPPSSDIPAGLGTSHTVPLDALRRKFSFPGTMRTGPDLSGIGSRQPDAAWHHRHLYAPRSVTPWSVMPSFRFLYHLRKIQGQPSDEAVSGLQGAHAPAEGWEIVPTPEAHALVAYLLSLKSAVPPEPTTQVPK